MIQVDVIWMQAVNPDWKSRGIMYAQGTNYSHVGLIGYASDGRKYLCHAIGGGVCYSQPMDYLGEHRIVFKKTVHLSCSQDLLTGFVMGEKGKEYSQMQLLLIAFKIRWACLMNGDSKRICSEFVAAIVDRWSEHKIPAPLDLITPRDLFDILKPEQVGSGI